MSALVSHDSKLGFRRLRLEVSRAAKHVEVSCFYECESFRVLRCDSAEDILTRHTLQRTTVANSRLQILGACVCIRGGSGVSLASFVR